MFDFSEDLGLLRASHNDEDAVFKGKKGVGMTGCAEGNVPGVHFAFGTVIGENTLAGNQIIDFFICSVEVRADGDACGNGVIVYEGKSTASGSVKEGAAEEGSLSVMAFGKSPGLNGFVFSDFHKYSVL